MKNAARFVFPPMLFLFSAIGMFGSPVGSVAGSVKDTSGAMMAGVKLTLVNSATNAQLVTRSNANGEFQFLQLAPSTYSLAAENPGFRKTEITSVLVQVDQVTHVDIVLEVGNVTESVQVEAVAPLLETDKST